MKHITDAFRYLTWQQGNSQTGSQRIWSTPAQPKAPKLITSGQQYQYWGHRQQGKYLWTSTTSQSIRTHILYLWDLQEYENLLRQELGWP